MKSKKNPNAVRLKSSRTRRAISVGDRLVASLTELRNSLRQGDRLEKRFTVRTVRMPDDPAPYNSIAVRQTRARLGASQAVFAKLVGVSTVLEQSWEQGSRKPSKLACRLLDEINRDIDAWRARIGAVN